MRNNLDSARSNGTFASGIAYAAVDAGGVCPTQYMRWPQLSTIEIKDRFGNPVKPREWFLVPLFVVNEVVERIRNGTITEYVYDPATASLVRRNPEPLGNFTSDPSR